MALIIITGLIAPQINPIIEANFGFIIGIKITNTVALTGLSFAAIVGVISNILINGVKEEKIEEIEILSKELV